MKKLEIEKQKLIEDKEFLEKNPSVSTAKKNEILRQVEQNLSSRIDDLNLRIKRVKELEVHALKQSEINQTDPQDIELDESGANSQINLLGDFSSDQAFEQRWKGNL